MFHSQASGFTVRFRNIMPLCVFKCFRSWDFISVLFIVMQYSRNVSQTRWFIDDERMGEESVEVLLRCTICVCILFGGQLSLTISCLFCRKLWQVALFHYAGVILTSSMLLVEKI